MNHYYLKNFYLLDGTINMAPKKDLVIEVKENKIIRIGNFEIPQKSKVIDLKEKYLCPGLINLHAHIPASGKEGKKKVASLYKLVKFMKSNSLTRWFGTYVLSAKYVKIALNSGVTTLRSVGGIGNFDSTLRDAIAKGKKVGPRLIVADEAICPPGGHMEGTVSHTVHNIEEANQIIEETCKRADLIKLMITGGVLDAQQEGGIPPLKMNKELVKACCDKAHSLGKKVAAHVESDEGIKIAIECGVDSIEHGAEMDEKSIELLKKHNGVVVATLTCAMPLIYIPIEKSTYGRKGYLNGKVVLDGIVKCAKQCLENGITVGMGNDVGSPNTTHYNFANEVWAFEKEIGVSKQFALHTATQVNATILGLDKEIGTIEENKIADMIVVNANPLDNLLNLKYPTMVIHNGDIIKHPKVKKNKKIEEKLAYFVK